MPEGVIGDLPQGRLLGLNGPMFRIIGKRRRLLAAIAAIAVMALGPRVAPAAEIAIACSALGQEQEHCRAGAQAWAERTGNTVKLISTPGSASEQLALYQQLLAAGADDIDVFQIDVVWPGILAQHFIDLAPAAGDRPARHFEAIIANNTVETASSPCRGSPMPGCCTTAPTCSRTRSPGARNLGGAHRDRPRHPGGRARRRQRQFLGLRLAGPGLRGADDERARMDQLARRRHVRRRGRRDHRRQPGRRPGAGAGAGWVGGISPPGVLNYTEEEARGVFQSGNALFMRNWPYAWALAQGDDSPVRGRVGIAVLPKGGADGTHSAALGGQQLAVSRYSAHPELAADLVMHLTSPEEQARRAIAGSFNPTIPALYDDPEIAEAVPVIAELRDIFDHAVPRPSTVTGADYNRVSAAVYDAVHRVLSGRAEPEAALARLARDLERIKRRGWRR
jgi:trehalose/maltose transport system substrate-binding protein